MRGDSKEKKPVCKDEKNKEWRGDGYETQQSSTDSTLNTGLWLQPRWSRRRYQDGTSPSAKPCWRSCDLFQWKVQVTANSWSVYSSFFKHVHYDEMLGATWTSSSYCFSWYIAVSHPDHRPSLSRKKRGNMGAGGFGWGRLDGNFDRWRWVMDKAVKSAVLPWLSLSCKVLPKLR